MSAPAGEATRGAHPAPVTASGVGEPGASPTPPAEVAAAAGITVDALFRRAFRIFADRVAVTSDQPDEASWTYRELGERTDRLAAGLYASGLRRGDRLAVLSETRPSYVALYTAAARLGVALITLNVRLHPDELAAVVAAAGPAALVTSGTFAPSAEAVRDSAPSVTAWYCLDPRPGFDELPRSDAPAPEPAAQPGDLHNVLYTCGTTGPPKGAMISQQAAAIRGAAPGPVVRAHRRRRLHRLAADVPLRRRRVPLRHDADRRPVRVPAPRRRPRRCSGLIERDRLSWTLLLPGRDHRFPRPPAAQARPVASFRFAIGYANMMPQRGRRS